MEPERGASSPDVMRLVLMQMAEDIKPIREFLMGEVSYFERQGFTKEQARALAAAEFTSVFGTRILPTATAPDAGDG